MRDAIRSFAQFWPFYVREHSKPLTRLMHATGTVLSLVAVGLALTVSPWFFLVAFLVGYTFAWSGHFFVERNKPATFKHPFYSLAADYRMLFLMMTGKMRDEVVKHSSQQSAVSSQ